LSSLTISGGRVFTQVRRPRGGTNEEFCVALNGETGQEIWARPVGLASYPGDSGVPADGPRTTPSVDGDRVFVLSSYLLLFCLDAATGQGVWTNDLVTQFGGQLITYQNAASPLVIGDLVLVNANAPNQCLTAFHKHDGTLAWRRHNDRLTHATPVTATLGGVEQVIFFAQTGLVAVASTTGDVLWRHPLNYNLVSVAASPVVAGDLVYCSRYYPGSFQSALAGALVVRITNSAGTFASSQVWYKTNQLMNHWCTPVYYQGHFYGMYGPPVLAFKCIEAATGTERWSVSGFGYGSVLVAGGNILALTESGEVVLVAPNPATYTEIARFQAVRGSSWNVPAISNGRIYARSATNAACLDVAIPPLKLRPESGEDQGFRLFVGNADGSPLTSNRMEKITMSATTNLGAPPIIWTMLTNSLVFTNGQLKFDDREGRTRPRRFYRAEERP
jgi:outer membrane protein assembly factor BamB